MGLQGLKFGLEGQGGDAVLGLHEARLQLHRRSNELGRRLTFNHRLARDGEAPIFAIQLLQVVDYGFGMLSNMPIVPERIAKLSAKAPAYILGPLLGLVETMGPELLTEAASAAGTGPLLL
jgi:hypothetical protein